MIRFETVADAIRVLRPDSPLICLRPSAARAVAATFLESFGRTTAYAVKTNPEPAILAALVAEGVSAFDVASIEEMRAVRALAPAATLYYMHPVKARSEVRTALADLGVRDLSLDHPGELAKILEEADRAGVPRHALRLFVRVKTETRAAYELSRKFGASSDAAGELLRAVAAAGARAGLCFHVGSQSEGGAAFETAIAQAATVRSAAGVRLCAISVGGGFPADYGQADQEPLAKLLERIQRSLLAHGFGDSEWIAEPGRVIAAPAMSVVVRVTLRRGDEVFINDGVWGTLSDVWTGRLTLPTRVFAADTRRMATKPQPFRIMGTTCDCLDVLPEPFALPADIDEGDWIEVQQAGAYSMSLRTAFNGFYVKDVIEVDLEAPASRQAISVAPERVLALAV